MKRNYTKEFKVKACELVIKDNLAPKIVAEKFAINVVMLYRWISEYQVDEKDAFVGKGYQKPADAEIRKLKKQLADAEMEIEILKKAAAYFAAHPELE